MGFGAGFMVQGSGFRGSEGSGFRAEISSALPRLAITYGVRPTGGLHARAAGVVATLTRP